MKTVLTIAGFDPSAGAGVTADLMVFAAHELYGTAAITALTVQSTAGVQASHPVASELLADTLEYLSQDMRPRGIKVGIVCNLNNIIAISRYIDKIKLENSEPSGIPVVLDPVMVSSSGRQLLDKKGLESLRAELLPLADWITPNADELATLTGHQVRTREDLAASARLLQERCAIGRRKGRIGVFAKGGHLEKPDDLLLTPDGEEQWLAGEWIETNATHGTGCALSSAFLSRLVLGDIPVDAARKAKKYVAEAMRQAPGIGQGKGPLGLLWPLLGGPGR